MSEPIMGLSIKTKLGEGAPSELGAMENVSKYDHLFFPGFENKAVRYYYYLNHGLGIFNQFRNLLLAIVGLYIVLKLDNWLIMPAILIPSLVVLTILGYYGIHRMNKIMEWVGMRFASHYGVRQYNFNQGQYELLKDIKNILEKK